MKNGMKNGSTAATLEGLFRALSDKTRLRLLNLMNGSEVCVCFFVEILGDSQPKISRHLAYLRKEGIVAARRDGKWIHYRLAMPENPAAARVLTELLATLREDAEMKADRDRLQSVCCAPVLPDHLNGAPLPAAVPACAC